MTSVHVYVEPLHEHIGPPSFSDVDASETAPMVTMVDVLGQVEASVPVIVTVYVPGDAVQPLLLPPLLLPLLEAVPLLEPLELAVPLLEPLLDPPSVLPPLLELLLPDDDDEHAVENDAMAAPETTAIAKPI